jgi:hypothetical protein
VAAVTEPTAPIERTHWTRLRKVLDTFTRDRVAHLIDPVIATRQHPSVDHTAAPQRRRPHLPARPTQNDLDHGTRLEPGPRV